jgi:adenylyltransferase/sulfurtransferase
MSEEGEKISAQKSARDKLGETNHQWPTFENTRYNRQIQMPEWGQEGQEKLRNTSVTCIGAGGVKSTLLMALTAAGIGKIRIIEPDHVELSNLNRQILYRTSSIGKTKLDETVRTLTDLNPDVKFDPIFERVTSDNIERLCGGQGFIVEGGDSPAGRNLVNEYCLKTGKPFVHASAQFNYGYVFSVIPQDETACFACFFPEDHTRTEHTGPVPVSVLSTSIAGSLGAAEVIKYALGYKDRMYVNKRLCFSSLILSGEFTVENTPRNPSCSVCAPIYEKRRADSAS